MDEEQDTGGKGGGEVREKTNCCLNPSHLESAEVPIIACPPWLM